MRLSGSWRFRKRFGDKECISVSPFSLGGEAWFNSAIAFIFIVVRSCQLSWVAGPVAIARLMVSSKVPKLVGPMDRANCWPSRARVESLERPSPDSETVADEPPARGKAGVYLRNVQLPLARLQSANLSRVILVRANLTGADLFRVNLSGADLLETSLSGAVLWEANLEGGRGLTQEQLSQALLCRTVLPEGITLDPDRDCEELSIGD